MMRDNSNARWMARGLGLLSLGFGLPAIAMPDLLARTVGFRDESVSRSVLSLVGMRETICGLGLLATPRFAGWSWARVAGDAGDLALLGWALSLATDPAESRVRRNRLMASTAATAGIAALDVWNAVRLSRRGGAHERSDLGEGDDTGLTAKRAITVQRSRDEVYDAWRDFRNLPRFMENVQSVEITGENRSHWVAKAPAGATVEWDAEISEDRPHELISWRSLPGGSVDNSGSVRFIPAPAGKGTEIHVEIRYDPPAGRLGAAVAKIFGKEPGQQVAADLRRFKQVLETGEIARSDASARGGGPAQPSKQAPRQTEPAQLPGEVVQSYGI